MRNVEIVPKATPPDYKIVRRLNLSGKTDD